MARVRHFAAAAEAAGLASEEVDVPTLGALRDALVAAHGPGYGRVLERCSILVDGSRTESPDTPVAAATLVDILPPFAGG